MEEMPRGKIFVKVIEENDKIVGTAVASYDHGRNIGNLICFYLLPEKIGKGYGHLLYNKIEDKMKRKGARKIELEVFTDNKRARTFYEKHGFEDTGKSDKVLLGDYEYQYKFYEKYLQK
jgi:RimJ/RimL family protein N-acetyltransferase